MPSLAPPSSTEAAALAAVWRDLLDALDRHGVAASAPVLLLPARDASGGRVLFTVSDLPAHAVAAVLRDAASDPFVAAPVHPN